MLPDSTLILQLAIQHGPLGCNIIIGACPVCAPAYSVARRNRCACFSIAVSIHVIWLHRRLSVGLLHLPASACATIQKLSMPVCRLLMIRLRDASHNNLGVSCSMTGTYQMALAHRKLDLPTIAEFSGVFCMPALAVHFSVAFQCRSLHWLVLMPCHLHRS